MDRYTKGRCKPCRAVWIWPARCGKVRDAHCPKCGLPLARTAKGAQDQMFALFGSGLTPEEIADQLAIPEATRT